ncbi:hypothetical protein B484DRAFT_390443 [Ochromonadaceae sp. CCMP2298]|nr:hypothetical protein B484DRAFT_390443 [Ochromonadaceae sp. CCMP2298]
MSMQQQGDSHWSSYKEGNTSVVADLFQPFTALSLPLPRLKSNPDTVAVLVTVLRMMPRLSQLQRHRPMTASRLRELYRVARAPTRLVLHLPRYTTVDTVTAKV